MVVSACIALPSRHGFETGETGRPRRDGLAETSCSFGMCSIRNGRARGAHLLLTLSTLLLSGQVLTLVMALAPLQLTQCTASPRCCAWRLGILPRYKTPARTDKDAQSKRHEMERGIFEQETRLLIRRSWPGVIGQVNSRRTGGGSGVALLHALPAAWQGASQSTAMGSRAQAVQSVGLVVAVAMSACVGCQDASVGACVWRMLRCDALRCVAMPLLPPPIFDSPRGGFFVFCSVGMMVMHKPGVVTPPSRNKMGVVDE